MLKTGEEETCTAITSTDWCAQLVFHFFKSPLSLDKKKKKLNNQQQKQPTQETASNMHYPRNTVKKKNWRKQENKANIEFQHATLFLGQVFFHRKPPILLVFVVIKITDISNGCQQMDQAEKKGEERNHEATRHHHVTGPCTWPCSIPQDITYTHSFIHTRTHCKSCNRDTHTYTQTLCKIKYKHRLTLTKTSAFWHFPESPFSGCTKAKQAFMAEMFYIHINNALSKKKRKKHWTAVGQYCGFVLSARVDFWQHNRWYKAHQLYKKNRETDNETGRQTGVQQAEWQPITATLRGENFLCQNRKHDCSHSVAGHALTHSHTTHTHTDNRVCNTYGKDPCCSFTSSSRVSICSEAPYKTILCSIQRNRCSKPLLVVH